MFQLVYASTATCAFGVDDLVTLLHGARANNTKLGVSGMLLYQSGRFLQVLEGDEPVVRALYARIAADPRHTGTVVVYETAAARRDFPDWSMGFRDLDGSPERVVAGYSRILEGSLSPRQFVGDPPRAKALLLAFKNGDPLPGMAPDAAAVT